MFYFVSKTLEMSPTDQLVLQQYRDTSLLKNYMADLQKEKFRASGGSCHIWGRPAKFVVITFDTRYYILDIYEIYLLINLIEYFENILNVFFNSGG